MSLPDMVCPSSTVKSYVYGTSGKFYLSYTQVSYTQRC